MYVCIIYKLYTYIKFIKTADAREMRFGCKFQLKQINSARSVDRVKSNLAENAVKMGLKSAQLEHSNRQGSGPSHSTNVYLL